jgi:hypothetical protein
MRIRENEGEIAEAIRQMYASYPDSAKFDRHLHPDITIWESDQPGPLLSLPELNSLRARRRAEAGDPAAAQLWVADVLVDRWADRAAVARYVLHARTADGLSSFRVTDVFDGLQIVHHHAEQL